MFSTSAGGKHDATPSTTWFFPAELSPLTAAFIGLRHFLEAITSKSVVLLCSSPTTPSRVVSSRNLATRFGSFRRARDCAEGGSLTSDDTGGEAIAARAISLRIAATPIRNFFLISLQARSWETASSLGRSGTSLANV